VRSWLSRTSTRLPWLPTSMQLPWPPEYEDVRQVGSVVEKTRARDPAYRPTRIPLRPCSHPLQGGAKLMSVGAPNC
jgi:hypothetical protein